MSTRRVLGERSENTPPSHTLHLSPLKHRKPTPKPIRLSFPKSTPHPHRRFTDLASPSPSPLRSTFASPQPIRTIQSNDETFLLDYEMSDLASGDYTDDDEPLRRVSLAGSTPKAKPTQPAVRGPGRMMTPADSQEAPPSNASKRVPRLPTPTSQPLTRPRPDTPPRHDTVTEWDTPLADPSPNPRRRKTPRLSTPAKPIASGSKTKSSAKPRKSTPRITVRTSAPATAPVRRQTTARSASGSRRRSTGTAIQASTAKFKRTLPPTARKALKGLAVGFLDDEVEISPGDDPLLLLGLDSPPRPPKSARKSLKKSEVDHFAPDPLVAAETNDDPLSRRELELFDAGGDDLSDEEVGNDTFVHVRRGAGLDNLVNEEIPEIEEPEETAEELDLAHGWENSLNNLSRFVGSPRRSSPYFDMAAGPDSDDGGDEMEETLNRTLAMLEERIEASESVEVEQAPVVEDLEQVESVDPIQAASHSEALDGIITSAGLEDNDAPVFATVHIDIVEKGEEVDEDENVAETIEHDTSLQVDDFSADHRSEATPDPHSIAISTPPAIQLTPTAIKTLTPFASSPLRPSPGPSHTPAYSPLRAYSRPEVGSERDAPFTLFARSPRVVERVERVVGFGTEVDKEEAGPMTPPRSVSPRVGRPATPFARASVDADEDEDREEVEEKEVVEEHHVDTSTPLALVHTLSEAENDDDLDRETEADGTVPAQHEVHVNSETIDPEVDLNIGEGVVPEAEDNEVQAGDVTIEANEDEWEVLPDTSVVAGKEEMGQEQAPVREKESVLEDLELEQEHEHEHVAQEPGFEQESDEESPFETVHDSAPFAESVAEPVAEPESEPQTVVVAAAEIQAESDEANADMTMEADEAEWDVSVEVEVVPENMEEVVNPVEPAVPELDLEAEAQVEAHAEAQVEASIEAPVDESIDESLESEEEAPLESEEVNRPSSNMDRHSPLLLGADVESYDLPERHDLERGSDEQNDHHADFHNAHTDSQDIRSDLNLHEAPDHLHEAPDHLSDIPNDSGQDVSTEIPVAQKVVLRLIEMGVVKIEPDEMDPEREVDAVEVSAGMEEGEHGEVEGHEDGSEQDEHERSEDEQDHDDQIEDWAEPEGVLDRFDEQELEDSREELERDGGEDHVQAEVEDFTDEAVSDQDDENDDNDEHNRINSQPSQPDLELRGMRAFSRRSRSLRDELVDASVTGFAEVSYDQGVNEEVESEAEYETEYEVSYEQPLYDEDEQDAEEEEEYADDETDAEAEAEGEETNFAASPVPAAADDTFDSAGDDSFRSVVEVSSLDPRAAARAAAILKLNHAYIEHGVLPSPGPRRARSRSRTPADHGLSLRRTTSRHFETIESARRLTKEQLLHEAELEIVHAQATPSPSRSIQSVKSLRSVRDYREGSVFDSPATPRFPGAWATPKEKKRKRYADAQPNPSDVVSATVPAPVPASRPWGVPQWKRLERVFRAERQAWDTQRTVRPLPGGLVAWSRRRQSILPTSTRPQPAEISNWDVNRVVDAFYAAEGVVEGDMRGEWGRETVAMRVRALERRVTGAEGVGKGKDKERGEEMRTPKKVKVGEEEKRAVEPPSTIKRVMNWVWGFGSTTKPKLNMTANTSQSSAATGSVRTSQVDSAIETEQEMVQIPETQANGSTFLDKLKHVASDSTDDNSSIPAVSTFAAASAPLGRPMYPTLPSAPTSKPSRVAFPRSTLSTSTSAPLPIPRATSPIPILTTSTPNALRSYPSYPTSSSTPFSGLVSGSSGTPRVRDMVRSFESGAEGPRSRQSSLRDREVEKEKVLELRRVQSLVDKLRR